MAWHSMITKRPNKDRFKEDIKRRAHERDEQFKENWQRYEDENHDE
jgi:hypothetical protein